MSMYECIRYKISNKMIARYTHLTEIPFSFQKVPKKEKTEEKNAKLIRRRQDSNLRSETEFDF